MRNSEKDAKKLELIYQLRKCLLHLNRTYILAASCNETATIGEIKKCMDLIKRRIKVLSAKS